MANGYRVFGLTVQSELGLPAEPWRASGAPDVRVSIGSTPTELPGAVDVLPRYQTAPGRLLLDIPGTARYLVTDGREIVVEPAPGATPDGMQPFLIGSSFGALLQQRGALMLHASAIRIADSAVLFAGVRGTGKSTLAAAMLQRGCDVMADDLSAVTFAGAVPFVDIGFRRIKLRQDSADMLRLNAAALGPLDARDKRRLSTVPAVAFEPLPLRRIYVLGGRPTTVPLTITSVAGPVRLALLRKHTFRYRFLRGFGLMDAHFQQCVALLKVVEIFHVARPPTLACLPELVQTLTEHLGGLAAAHT